MITKNVVSQPSLVSDIPVIVNNKDYNEYCNMLDRIDGLLNISGIETEFVTRYIDSMLEKKQSRMKGPRTSLTRKELHRHSRYAVRALRCNIAGLLLQESLRGLSLRIAESFVLQRFCQVGDLVKIQTPSKSVLCDYRNSFLVESIQEAADRLVQMATNSADTLALKDPLETHDIYIDCTCLEGNIHFPVDWLLLRDGVRTIIKSILVIRQHGLRHRIGKPEGFLQEINRLCIEMTNARRTKGAVKSRKSILRKMKKITRIVEEHGLRYAMLLTENVDQSDLSSAEAAQIFRRLKNVLEQLPAAREQAHRRIITREQLSNNEKILSLYDEHVSVIKRGKSNAEVEFGNELFLAEQKDGLIVDWKLYADQPPPDVRKLPEFIKRVQAKPFSVDDICSDRGFFSNENKTLVQKSGMKSFLCPRDPSALKTAMNDDVFRVRQRRRAQTEGRVGIVKNCFTGNPTGSRVFEYRERQVAWAILTHNLWVLARLPTIQAEEKHAAA